MMSYIRAGQVLSFQSSLSCVSLRGVLLCGMQGVSEAVLCLGVTSAIACMPSVALPLCLCQISWQQVDTPAAVLMIILICRMPLASLLWNTFCSAALLYYKTGCVTAVMETAVGTVLPA